MEKPNILILGGCGFIGRNLVEYLVEEDLARFIRVVDKCPPQLAWFNKNHQKCFKNEIVEFKSANLINPESCSNAFSTDDFSWDFVINCAGETKYGQTDPVYCEGILNLSLNCARESAKHLVRRYVEISSGQMYSNEKIGHKEDCNNEPFGSIAKWKLEVEKELGNIPNLKFTILRPALVYGCGDKSGLTTRIVAAALYKELGKVMKLLWNSNLALNTIHVKDLCKAILFVCNKEEKVVGEIFNVVDEASSTQGTLANILSEIFNIKIDYYGTLLSAVVDLNSVADEANDKHLALWAEVCKREGTQNTPLTPYMNPELLSDKHLHLDGGKLKGLGFNCDVPKPSLDNIKVVIEDFIVMGIFPKALL
ncbi:uncharacterized protein [Onthophagus taurus]|uniref:uncharacterized protein n=1 Tax=Onthophagus taurus TaxID=166361 RepID=UPI000C209440|nr:uncharacterized protein LOC111422030 [Onthophagus taurus]